MHPRVLLPFLLLFLFVPAVAAAADLDADLRQQIAERVQEPLTVSASQDTTRLLEKASQRAMDRRLAQGSSVPRTTCAVDGNDVFVCVVRSAGAPAAPPAARASTRAN